MLNLAVEEEDCKEAFQRYLAANNYQELQKLGDIEFAAWVLEDFCKQKEGREIDSCALSFDLS